MVTQMKDRTVSAYEKTKELILERLDRLPLYRLQQVLAFSDFMLYEVMQSNHSFPVHDAQKGTTQDLLACVGLWQFEPGELEEIMADIEQGRLLEMGEDDIVSAPS